MIQKPARNSLDSGKMPSVMGMPFLAARTSFASSGSVRPSARTNSPASLSSLLSLCINAMCASRSCFAQARIPSLARPAFMVFIIKIYFMTSLLCVRVSRSLRFPQLGGLGRLLWTARYADLAAWLAMRRTSIGILVGTPPVRALPNSSHYRVSALWSLHVNDPVAQEKLLGLGEDAVHNRHAALRSTHQRGLVWHS